MDSLKLDTSELKMAINRANIIIIMFAYSSRDLAPMNCGRDSHLNSTDPELNHSTALAVQVSTKVNNTLLSENPRK